MAADATCGASGSRLAPIALPQNFLCAARPERGAVIETKSQVLARGVTKLWRTPAPATTVQACQSPIHDCNLCKMMAANL